MSFKILKNNCCGLDVHKTWIFACIGITDSNKRTVYKQARFSSFTKGLQELCHWLAKYDCTDVCMESTGKYWIPVFNILEKNNIWVTLSHPKYTKPQKGNKTDRKDAKWICDLYMCGMVKPSFIPPADIRELRDLVRYRFKLTCMITGEKNRAHNCLTVSNLKLDDVFSDIFGRSSRSITEQILQHPGETFDVAPFVHGRCKTPIEEIQAAVDGAVSKEQAVKLRQCLNHIDELEMRKSEIERDFKFDTAHLPDEIIDAFVDEIEVHKEYFIWRLNISPDDAIMKVSGRVNNYTVSQTDRDDKDNNGNERTLKKSISAVLDYSDTKLQHRQLSLTSN